MYCENYCKLLHFGVRDKAEFIRYIFAFLSLPYQDIRVDRHLWNSQDHHENGKFMIFSLYLMKLTILHRYFQQFPHFGHWRKGEHFGITTDCTTVGPRCRLGAKKLAGPGQGWHVRRSYHGFEPEADSGDSCSGFGEKSRENGESTRIELWKQQDQWIFWKL